MEPELIYSPIIAQLTGNANQLDFLNKIAGLFARRFAETMINFLK